MRVRVLVGKHRDEKYILSLSLESVKVDGYNFSHPRAGPRKSPPF